MPVDYNTWCARYVELHKAGKMTNDAAIAMNQQCGVAVIDDYARPDASDARARSYEFMRAM